MIDDWIQHCRRPPYAHQIVGVQNLVKWSDPSNGRICSGCYFLGDEMGAGKTKQCVDAAQILFWQEEIDSVIVVCPASVRDVWYDEEIGQLAAHLWEKTSAQVFWLHSKWRQWRHLRGDQPGRNMVWYVTNYEFLRGTDRVENDFADLAGDKTLLILDESSAVKWYKTKQARAVKRLREECQWVWELNGTPVTQGPGDMYSQAAIMDPQILGCKNYFHFRARYAIMGGWQGKQIKGWRDIDDLQRRLAPYVIRRLKTDCLDLPPKLDPVTITATLTTDTWRLYKEMRDDFVAWLTSPEQASSTALQAGVKALRLAQLCAGFVGGVQVEETCEVCAASGEFCEKCGGAGVVAHGLPPTETSREKLDAVLEWCRQKFSEDPNSKLVVWCRFRPELQRLHDAMVGEFLTADIGRVWGGQDREDRTRALRLLKPQTAPSGAVIVLGTPGSGSMGHDFSAAHDVLWASHGTSLKDKLQADDRVHRPGQTYPVSYHEIVAEGPSGQRTIDHAIVAAMRRKEELATWTCSAWVRALKEE